jgi:hypothetical protein
MEKGITRRNPAPNPFYPPSIAGELVWNLTRPTAEKWLSYGTHGELVNCELSHILAGHVVT